MQDAVLVRFDLGRGEVTDVPLQRRLITAGGTGGDRVARVDAAHQRAGDLCECAAAVGRPHHLHVDGP